MVDIEKCQITYYPAKVLAGSAERIEKIDDNIRQLAEKMTDIMLQTEGIGLAIIFGIVMIMIQVIILVMEMLGSGPHGLA